MTDKEAMKLALDALEEIYDAFKVKRDMAFYKEDYDEAIIALKEALAQPEQTEVQQLIALVRAQQITIDKLEMALADPMREVQRLGQEIEQEPVAHWSDCAVHSEPAYPKSECDCGGIVAVADYTALSDKYVALSDKYVALKAQHKEQEPVAWLLTDKNINSLQVDSIQRLINRLNHAHHTDLCVRINGQDEWFQADWLKHMVRATPPQRTEQEPVMWEVTQGGAYKFGDYLVVERVDGKGWNARKGDEHLLLASSLNACRSACEYDFTHPPQPPQRTEHITDGSPCWCEPELDYKDPDTGAEVWIHRETQ